MSEKRFEVDVDHLLLVWDTEKNQRLEIEDIVGVLNEQQDRIKQLDQENANLVGDKIRSLEEFEKCTDKLKKTILNLREDNGQLRQILKDIVCATDETYTENTSMFKVTVVLDYEKYREIRRCIE